MKIGINLLTLEPGKIGGMEQYIRNLLWYTVNKFNGYELFLFLNSRNEHTFEDGQSIKKIIVSEDPLLKELELYKGIMEYSLDLWFCPLLNLEPKYINIPSVVTIPDLQHEFFPEFFSKDIINWRNENFKFTAHKADAILTLSKYSQKSIVDIYGVDESKVHSIYLDSSKEFYDTLDDNHFTEIKNKYSLPDVYGFYPANTWPHKNHISLLKASNIIKNKYKKEVTIVFTGCEHQASEEVKKYISENNLTNNIRFLGYVKQEEMPYIFKGAHYLVFPSLFEGFGIPLVEAMRTNTPIICSGEGSIPEVVGSAALIFNPKDPEDIASKILNIHHADVRNDLVKKGIEQSKQFSWEISSKETLAVFEEVYEKSQSAGNENFPLVSIVTPSYNQGKFIKETIDSVLNQDYPNIEYIVMDGGSTDETVEILKSYGNRIKWTSEKDEGQADAVNKGIKLARGQIIGWLNSDDTYLPGAVTQAVKFFNRHQDIGMVYGEGYHTKENGEIIDRYPTESFRWDRLAQTCFICQPTAFFRKEVLESVGYLNKDLHLCMDYELWMRIGRKSKIAYIPYFFATSRMYEDNKTLSRRKEVFTEIIKTVRHHFQYVPLSWVYGYVDYKLGPKRNAYFFIMLFFHFILANYKNPVYCVKEFLQILKSRVKYQLHLKQQTFVEQYADGWVSRKYVATIDFKEKDEAKSTLVIKGRHLAPNNKVLKVKVFINDQFIKKLSIRAGEFLVEIPVSLSGESIQLTLVANKSFVPKKSGVSDDDRELAYILDQIELK